MDLPTLNTALHIDMVVSLKCSCKMAALSLVTRETWIELAVWRTIRSSLKGWGGKWTPVGFSLTSPWIGVGWCWKVGRD
jgi:hypothetical protein